MTLILRIFRQYNTIWTVRFAELMAGSIGGMTNVEELTLSGVHYVWANQKLDEGLESLFRIAFSVATVTFGSTLRSLTLNLAPQAFYHALMPTPIFPKLEHLSVNLTFMRPNGVSDVLRGFLVPFINGHCSTIEHLTLTLVTQRCYDASIHMRGICYLPRLQKLDLDFDVISMDPSGSSGLRHMLETHSDELRELFITFPPFSIARTDPLLPSEWFKGDIGSVALPHLNILSLRTGCHVILGESAGYLQRFGNSLTTLILEHTFFSSRGVEVIINVLSGYKRLEKLYLAVTNLDPALFDLILMKLPNLTFLHLTFLQVRASGFQHPHNEGGNEVYAVSTACIQQFLCLPRVEVLSGNAESLLYQLQAAKLGHSFRCLWHFAGRSVRLRSCNQSCTSRFASTRSNLFNQDSTLDSLLIHTPP